MNSQFNKGVLEMCVLALLAKRDFYGYELVATISEHVDISEGTIYPLLRRLTQENYVETYLQESKEGPSRKYYRMTVAGKKHTKNLVAYWKKFAKNINTLLEVKHEKI